MQILSLAWGRAAIRRLLNEILGEDKVGDQNKVLLIASHSLGASEAGQDSKELFIFSAHLSNTEAFKGLLPGAVFY